MDNNSVIIYKKNMVRIIFIFILTSFIFRYYNHVMLHQLRQPVIFKTDADYAYWFYHLANFKKIIIYNSSGALAFDYLLTGLCIICILFPAQNYPIIMFSILYPLYFLSYNTFVTIHTGTMDGILLITFAFWSVKETTFTILWQALRYYTISIYVMAFFYKVFIYASIFSVSQPIAILKVNQALYLYLNPNTFFADCMYWFLQHPLLLYTGYILCVLLQGCMALGFFTKKYDNFLFFIPVIFHISTYIFVDVCYFELLILNLTFISKQTFNHLMTMVKTPYISKHFTVA